MQGKTTDAPHISVRPPDHHHPWQLLPAHHRRSTSHLRSPVRPHLSHRCPQSLLHSFSTSLTSASLPPLLHFSSVGSLAIFIPDQEKRKRTLLLLPLSLLPLPCPLPELPPSPSVTLSASSPSAGTASPSLAPPPHEPHQAFLLASILSKLGFQELAIAMPAMYLPVLSAWSGPLTLFARSADSLHSCPSYSPLHLLREHLVPGLFSLPYLSKLTFGTKLETASPGRCLTVTSSSAAATPPPFPPSLASAWIPPPFPSSLTCLASL